MSLSAAFCTLLVACPVFECSNPTPQADGSIRYSPVMILKKLASLIARTYWTPTWYVDGPQAVQRRENGDGKIYLADLRSKAVDYIRSVNELYIRTTIVARHLDKPNLLRLLELYTFTFPAFGHVNHFMELVFQCAHQPLKRCITRGNHRNDHLSAMEHRLGNDWQAWLLLLKSEVESRDHERRRSALFGLKRLLLGRFHEESNITDTELDQAIQDVFAGPVEFILRLQCTPMTLKSPETSVWMGRGKSSQCQGKSGATGLEGERELWVLRRIWELYTLLNPLGPEEIGKMRLFKEMARRLKGNSGDLRNTGSGVHRVGVGGAVHIFVSKETENSGIITSGSANDGVAALYCVVCIIDDGEFGVVTVLLRCDLEGPFIRIRSRLGAESVQLLLESGSLRRVGTVHACHMDIQGDGEHCDARDRDRTVGHTKKLLEAGTYYHFKKEEGYPPRMA